MNKHSGHDKKPRHSAGRPGGIFAFMHHYRVPILAVIFFGLAGLGVWSAVENLFARDRNPLEGTFLIPGSQEPVEVRLEDEIAVYRRFKQYPGLLKLTGDKDEQLAAWDFLILQRLGQVMGVKVSDQEIIEGLARGNKEAERQIRNNRDFLDWQHRLRQTLMAKTLVFSDPGGLTWKTLYARFKDADPRLKLRFAVFQQKQKKDFPIDPKQAKDKQKLEKFAKENPGVTAGKEIKEKIDLEAVWVRFRPLPGDKSYSFEQEFKKSWQPLADKFGLKLSQAELLSRYQKQQMLYDKLASELVKKKKTKGQQNGKKASSQDQKTQFETVKERIKQELLVYKLFLKFKDEAGKLSKKELKAADALGSLAKKYHFKHGLKPRLTRLEFQKIPEFGTPQYMGRLFQAAAQKARVGRIMDPKNPPASHLLEGVCDMPTTVISLLRPSRHLPARPPTVDEKPEIFVDAWQERQVQDDLKGRAEAFKKKVQSLLDESIKDKRQELVAQTKRDVKKEIKDAGLDRNKKEDKDRIAEIESRLNAGLAAKLEPLKARHEAEAFQAAAKELKLSLKTSPYLEAGLQGVPQYSDDPLPEEKIRRVLRNMAFVNTVKRLDKGRMGEPYVEKRAGLALVALLDDRKEPTVEDLYKAEGGDLVNRLKRELQRGIGNRDATADLTYQNFKSAAWFSINSKVLEDAVAKAAKRAALDALRRRQEAVLRRKRAERRRKLGVRKAVRKTSVKGVAPRLKPGQHQLSVGKPSPAGVKSSAPTSKPIHR